MLARNAREAHIGLVLHRKDRRVWQASCITRSAEAPAAVWHFHSLLPGKGCEYCRSMVVWPAAYLLWRKGIRPAEESSQLILNF
jgi:hypothetical protein